MQTIIRTLKLKTTADISASDNHCRRISEVNNADPGKRHLNFEYNGDNGIQDDIIAKGQTLVERIRTLEQERGIITPRKDSVKCVEIVMAAPPYLFEKEGTPTKSNSLPNGETITEPKGNTLFEQWLHANYRFAKNYFSDTKDYTNVVSMQVHLDETSPHIHIHVMPIHKGRYNCKYYLGGSTKMQALQDAYYKHMKENVPSIEWERGQKKSITGRSHRTVKEYYQMLGKAQELGIGDKVVGFIEQEIRKAEEVQRHGRQEAYKVIQDIAQQQSDRKGLSR